MPNILCKILFLVHWLEGYAPRLACKIVMAVAMVVQSLRFRPGGETVEPQLAEEPESALDG